MKMIGVCSASLRMRMNRAVSKPSMIGICTSMRITANALLHHRAQRGLARLDVDDRVPERLEDATDREVLGGVVVHHQDRRAGVEHHVWPRRTARRRIGRGTTRSSAARSSDVSTGLGM